MIAWGCRYGGRGLRCALDYLGITHVALRVPQLREAERYYAELFGLEVAWRDSLGAASVFSSWEELDHLHVTPAVVMLWRDSLRLALSTFEDDEAGALSSSVDHIGVLVSVERLHAVRGVAVAQGLEVIGERADELFAFVDAHGIQWELDSRNEDPAKIGRRLERLQSESQEPK